MQAFECGYGHKIIDGDKIIYTSQQAMAADMENIFRMFSKSVEMLSELIDIEPEDIVGDLYDISGCNMMNEAFNAVLEKQGKKVYIPTLTETAFDAAIHNKNKEVNHGRVQG